MKLPITMTYHDEGINMIASLWKKVALACFIPIIMTGCTYSITMVHTSGQASDVVDEQQTPSTSVTPTVTIPAAAL